MNKDFVIEHITCPVCMNLCEAPIQQCSQSHILCNACIKQITPPALPTPYENLAKTAICPMCRVECKTWSRNRVLEDLAGLYLKDHAYECPIGCGEMLTYGNAGHIKQCSTNLIACLVPDCPKKVPRTRLLDHIETTHARYFAELSVEIDVDLELKTLTPVAFQNFTAKSKPTGQYLVRVTDKKPSTQVIATWFMVKRHRKSHVEMTIECLSVLPAWKSSLLATFQAYNGHGVYSRQYVVTRAHAKRDPLVAGFQTKDMPSYRLSTFEFDANRDASVIFVPKASIKRIFDADEKNEKEKRPDDDVVEERPPKRQRKEEEEEKNGMELIAIDDESQ